jgi:hypothetical protein
MSQEVVKKEKQELTPVDRLKNEQQIAKTLVDFVNQSGMVVSIKGNKYLKAETWNFLFRQFGYRPVITKTGKIDQTTYKARCEVYDKDDKIVTSGDAICSKNEASKRAFDDYALLSMAETRALAKAGRLAFGYIVSLAGYSPTPAEEITVEVLADNKPSTTPPSAVEPQPETDYTILDPDTLATEKQRNALYKFKVPREKVQKLTKQQASDMLDELITQAKGTKTTETVKAPAKEPVTENEVTDDPFADFSGEPDF